MSVESAREEVLNRFIVRDAEGSFKKVELAFNALDRLILEVQAAMPCYDGDAEGRSGCERYFFARPCPSCSARQALKVAVA